MMIRIVSQVVSFVSFNGYIQRPKAEPKPVRFYNHPTFNGRMVCPHCSKLLEVHGWLDHSPNGQVVCPGMLIVTFESGDVRAMPADMLKILKTEELAGV